MKRDRVSLDYFASMVGPSIGTNVEKLIHNKTYRHIIDKSGKENLDTDLNKAIEIRIQGIINPYTLKEVGTIFYDIINFMVRGARTVGGQARIDQPITRNLLKPTILLSSNRKS